MTYAVETSWIRIAVDWPVKPGSFPYAWDSFSQSELPIWMRDREKANASDTVKSAWDILSDQVLSKCPTVELVRCSYGLWVFNSATASVCASRLSPLHPRIYRAMEENAQYKESWPLETLTHCVISLRDDVKLWLAQLPSHSIGILRLYEWGKF